MDDYQGADSADAPEARRLKAPKDLPSYKRYLTRPGPIVATERPSLLGATGLFIR